MPRPQRSALPGAQRFLFWLSQAAKDLRENGGINVETVAGLYGVRGRTIERFEVAESWPGDPDRLMAAYARAVGLADPRDIYQRALDQWRDNGQAPELDSHAELKPGPQFERDLQAHRAAPRDQPAPARRTTATRKRAAGS